MMSIKNASAQTPSSPAGGTENTPTFILNDLPSKKDALDFSPYVETLADIIVSHETETPLTIGVFGDWGSGKTTLMQMVQAKLEHKALVAWFDPWRYEREETLWRALLLKVLTTLESMVTAEGSDEDKKAMVHINDLKTALYRTVEREETGGLRIDWEKLAQGVGHGALQIGLSFIPGGTVLADLVKKLQDRSAENAVDELNKAIEHERSKFRMEKVEFLDQFHGQFHDLVHEYVRAKQLRLVVFVDDLDRCLPEKAVEVLEAIKLFLDVPGCVFILGLDQEVIARGIEIKYRKYGRSLESVGKETGRRIIDGSRYLEKIIQLSFHIPPIERNKMSEFVSALVRTWPHRECPNVFSQGLGDNPRQVKRTINVFLLLWQLAKKGDLGIQPVRLAKVVAIQHIDMSLYKLLRDTPRLLADLEDFYRQESEALHKDEPDAEKRREPLPVLAPYVHHPAVRRLFTLHPGSMEDVNFSGLKPKELRRYFTLTRRTETIEVAATERPVSVFDPQMVRIPAGLFLMGSTDDDKNAKDIEKPQHSLELLEYFIAKYPVTNAEYHIFVQETGHRPPSHWSKAQYPEEKSDHPVVHVTWHDAVAYCKWLKQKTGQPYGLPSEAEWEKAARGTQGIIFPWGNTFDKTKLNSREGEIGDTTAVGQYSPEGDSPFGASDMAGNVWEWTRSLWGRSWENPDFKYPYDPNDGRENLKAENEILRVLRGGEFGSVQWDMRCAFRYMHYPDFRDGSFGFRVVLSPFFSES